MNEDLPNINPGVPVEAWKYLHPRVREIFGFCEIAFSKRDIACLITSMIRPHTTDTGIHATGRALDFVLRNKDGGNTVSCGTADNVTFASFFSKVFVKYKKGPAVIYHDVGLGYHFHIQVESTPDFQDLNGIIPSEQSPTVQKTV